MWYFAIALLLSRSVHSAPVDHGKPAGVLFCLKLLFQAKDNPVQSCGQLHCITNNVTVDNVQYSTNIHSVGINDKCIYTELVETLTNTSERVFALTMMASHSSKLLDELCNQVTFSIDDVVVLGTVSEDACYFHIEVCIFIRRLLFAKLFLKHAECARIKLHTANKMFHGDEQQGDSAGGCIFRDSDSLIEGSASYGKCS